MANPPSTSKPQASGIGQDERRENTPDQPVGSGRPPEGRAERHYGAQSGQPSAQGDAATSGAPSQGYGTQMSGGTQSGQQSGSYSSDYGSAPLPGTHGNALPDDSKNAGRSFDRSPNGRNPVQGERQEPLVGAQNQQRDPQVARGEQDFGQRPGFGGYGSDGGGYGSQASYGSHNTYRSGDPGQQSGYRVHSEAPDWETDNQRTYGWRQPDAGWPGQTQRRGPKGYQRSDERIREDICERLLHSRHIDSSEVTIEVSDGYVILEGTVPDRRMKHAIEDLADSISGVSDVENRVRVLRGGALERDEQRGGSGWSGSGDEVTQRQGTGTTSSHTGTGTRTEGYATGASAGATFGGATTPLMSGLPQGSETRDDTASRGPGSEDALAGRSVSSSSTAKSPRDL